MSKRFVILFFVSLVIASLGGLTLYAQGSGGKSTPTPSSSSSPVVILVVDAFEVDTTGNYDPVLWKDNGDNLVQEMTDENCVVAPDGQDGSGWGNDTGPYYLTSALHPGPDPHGRQVFRELQSLVKDASGAPPTHLGDGNTLFGTPWIRDVESATVGNGEVILVGVDTDQYRTSDIAKRIVDAINLWQNKGVTRFVLNMSFAIIPCQYMPEVTVQEYQALIDKAKQGTTPQDIAVAGLDSLFKGLPADARHKVGPLSASASGSDVFGLLRQRAYFEIAIPALQAAFDNAYPKSINAPNCDVLQNNMPNFLRLDAIGALLDVFQPSAAKVCKIAIKLPGSASGLQKDLDNFRQNTDDGKLSVIPIASAGNEGRNFPYAPGLWPTVVSISAEYTGYETCSTPAGASKKPSPLSNNGEVAKNGMFECHAGTSFAAPRLSMEAALYLLAGGNVVCTGTLLDNQKPEGISTTSSPPLAHLPWDNLERRVASVRYCEDFNNLVP